MPSDLAKRLAALPTLSLPALFDLWKELFPSPPPAHIRRNLLVAILAYRMQEQAFGPLSCATRNRLLRLARAYEADPQAPIPSIPAFKPGTRLVRKWRDQVHLVNVESNGYEYQGSRYQSLSEIARLITGTRWSGPLFFGVKKQGVVKREGIQ